MSRRSPRRGGGVAWSPPAGHGCPLRPAHSCRFRAALFEAECQPGAASAVAAEFAAIPQVFSVNITTGTDNLYAFVVAADQPLLAELVVDTLPAIAGAEPGAIGADHPIVQRHSLAAGRSEPRPGSGGNARAGENHPAHEFDEFDRELFLALQRDGRLSFRDLAAAVGRPEPTVRRRMGLLTHAGMLAFRTDFARVQAGWPTAVALKLSVTGSAVAAVGRTLVRYPETRFCVAVTGGGAADLFVTMQLHNVSDLDPVIHRLSAEHPGVAVLDTRVVLRSRQVLGTAARTRRPRTGRRPGGPLGAGLRIRVLSRAIGRAKCSCHERCSRFCRSDQSSRNLPDTWTQSEYNPACDDPVEPLGERTWAAIAAVAVAKSGPQPQAGATTESALRARRRQYPARATSPDAGGRARRASRGDRRQLRVHRDPAEA